MATEAQLSAPYALKCSQSVGGVGERLYSAHLLQAMQRSLFNLFLIFKLGENIPDGLLSNYSDAFRKLDVIFSSFYSLENQSSVT